MRRVFAKMKGGRGISWTEKFGVTKSVAAILGFPPCAHPWIEVDVPLVPVVDLPPAVEEGHVDSGVRRLAREDGAGGLNEL